MRKCPKCSHTDVKVLETRDAPDHRVQRRRQCSAPECGHRWTTLEVFRDLVEVSKPQTLPQALATPLFDLESALEQCVQDAVTCIRDSIAPGASVDKGKVDLAKWLVEDRRKWRIGIAEQAALSGETPEDPAVAQLASILRLVE